METGSLPNDRSTRARLAQARILTSSPSSCVKTGRPAQTLGEGDRISKRLAGTSGSQLLQSKINRALLNACGLDLPREHAMILYEQAF